MKVILLTDIKGVGKKNEIVDVSDGYAMNCLLKQNKAVVYSQKSLDVLNKQLDKQKQIYQETINEANLLKDKIEKIVLTFYLKANNGNAFGSVSNKMIIDELNKHDIKVDKFMLESNNALGLGIQKVSIKLHKDVIAKLTVQVFEEK